MQFILSKLLAVGLYPSNWIIVLAIFCLITRSKTWKKRGFITLVVLLLLSSNPFLYRRATLQWQPARQTIQGTYEAGILPGGLSGYDKDGNGYFSGAADRFIETSKLFHQGIIKTIIVTGGNGRLERSFPPEADFLQRELIANGIPASKIILETKSRNTQENALFTRKIYDSLHLSGQAVLITSAIHMPRCRLEFSKAGIPTIAAPCNYEVIPGNNSFFAELWPDLALTTKWGALIKEWIGYLLVKYR